MNILKAKDYTALSRLAAQMIAGAIVADPSCVLGLATGSTPVGTYEELRRLHREAGLDFSRLTTFNLDEYYGCPATDKNSYHHFMRQHLFDHVNVDPGRVHLPGGMAADAAAECRAYERRIAEAGGIDLQLLGIGHNGHIGFNEPDDHFPAETGLVQLAPSTIDANARFYDSRDQVPKKAISMGIGTILHARRILLLVSGADKREIVETALHGPITPRVPASALQLHRDVTVILAVD